jgi:hypothetical protein
MVEISWMVGNSGGRRLRGKQWADAQEHDTCAADRAAGQDASQALRKT